MTAAGLANAVSCVHFEPIPGSRRCQHYINNGACQRPDILMCTEWLKLNEPAAAGHQLAPPRQPTPSPQPLATAAKTEVDPTDALEVPAEGVERDLFGRPVRPPVTIHRSKPRPGDAPGAASAQPNASQPSTSQLPTAPEIVTAARLLQASDIATFKQNGVEVCLRTETLGPVWLVGSYTGQARCELTIEHALLVATVSAAFPGATVEQIRSGSPSHQRQEPHRGE